MNDIEKSNIGEILKKVSQEASNFIKEKCKDDLASISTVVSILIAEVLIQIPPDNRDGFKALMDKAVNTLITSV